MNTLFMLLVNPFDFGITVSIVGFGIVVFALTMLSVVFSRLPKIINMKFKKKSGNTNKPESATTDDGHIEGNVTAAIGMALHLYLDEMHDEESNVVTIKQVRKAYSPWSSKIYSVTQNWPKN
ncbi:Oxaloacetate decarboxylase, gamma chain [Mariniphaga anaerophila]|uniref:Oxaloacetate decarboxylase, gamma chain n=1 Tax=Mariniphaga anaerophila TaxID=1484053 RepID=A0A1M4TV93_9BACT|nr:OadG family protein [Mariniphaga anaerophila]SHE48370.1 Oxaloacetate decarboxylase, gamma chain [Mariniphaga anaerophila]